MSFLWFPAGKEADITWTKDGEDVDDGRHLLEKVDETTSKLYLKKVELKDSGVYKCNCEYENHEDSIQITIFVYGTWECADWFMFIALKLNFQGGLRPAIPSTWQAPPINVCLLFYYQRSSISAKQNPIMSSWWTGQRMFHAWSLGNLKWRSAGIEKVTLWTMTVGPSLEAIDVVRGSPRLPHSLCLQLAEWRGGDGGRQWLWGGRPPATVAANL